LTPAASDQPGVKCPRNAKQAGLVEYAMVHIIDQIKHAGLFAEGKKYSTTGRRENMCGTRLGKESFNYRWGRALEGRLLLGLPRQPDTMLKQDRSGKGAAEHCHSRGAVHAGARVAPVTY